MAPASDTAILERLARALPDVPRWVETRSMLLGGECEVFGLDDVGLDDVGLDEDAGLSFVARDTAYPTISVVGRPPGRAIREAAARDPGSEIVVPREGGPHVAAALPGWEAKPATLHALDDESRLPRVPAGSARLLEPSEIPRVEGLPDDLRSELMGAARWSPIAASLAENGRAVAFCYADRTEGLWDVAIDTLEEYRGRGHAARCGSFMVEHLRPLRPVWCAEDENRASLGLAAKLGFVPVDGLLLFRAR